VGGSGGEASAQGILPALSLRLGSFSPPPLPTHTRTVTLTRVIPHSLTPLTADCFACFGAHTQTHIHTQLGSGRVSWVALCLAQALPQCYQPTSTCLSPTLLPPLFWESQAELRAEVCAAKAKAKATLKKNIGFEYNMKIN